MDLRKTYPCETAEALDRAVDVACEGWITLEDATQSKSLSVARKRLSNNELLTTVRFLANGSIAAPPVSFNMPRFADGDLSWIYNSLITPIDPALYAETWSIRSPSVTYTERAQWESPSYGAMTFLFSANAQLIVAPMRWTAGEVAEALVDVSIQAPEHTVLTVEYNSGGSFGRVEDTDFSAVTFGVYLITTNAVTTEATLRLLGPGPSLSGLALVTIGSIEYLQGTLDVTDEITAALVTPLATNERLAFVLHGPSDLSISSHEKMLYELIDEWEVNYTGSTPSSYRVATHTYTHKGLGITNLRIRPNADALNDAARFHFDSRSQAAIPGLV